MAKSCMAGVRAGRSIMFCPKRTCARRFSMAANSRGSLRERLSPRVAIRERDGQTERAWKANCGGGESRVAAARLRPPGPIAVLVLRRALLVHFHRISAERVVKRYIFQYHSNLAF